MARVETLMAREKRLKVLLDIALARESRAEAKEAQAIREQRQVDLTAALVTLQERYVELAGSFETLTKEFHDRQDAWIEAYAAAQRSGHLLGVDVVPPLRMPPMVPRSECEDWTGKYSGHVFGTRSEGPGPGWSQV